MYIILGKSRFWTKHWYLAKDLRGCFYFDRNRSRAHRFEREEIAQRTANRNRMRDSDEWETEVIQCE